MKTCSVFLGSFLFITSFISYSCAQEVPADISKPLHLYMESVTSHAYDLQWRRSVNYDVFHNDLNGLGFKFEYPEIKETLPRVEGMFLFSELKLSEVRKTLELLKLLEIAGEPDTEKSIVYYAKLEYLVVASHSGKVDTVFDKPRKMTEYLVFAKDKYASEYRIIDKYPTIKANFLSAEYALTVFAEVSKDQSFKEKVKKALAATKGS